MRKTRVVLLSVFVLVALSACNLPAAAAPSVTPLFLTQTPTPAPAISPSPTPRILEPTDTVLITPAEEGLSAARYAVILVESEDVLNIRSAAGTGFDVTGQFAFDEDNVRAAGGSAEAGGDTWLEVENPAGGFGWVNAHYLTEYVSAQDFCKDTRVNALLDNLAQAASGEDRVLMEELVSPAHGLELYYHRGGPSANYTPKEAAWAFESTFEVNWGAGPSGIDDTGTFREYPLPALLDVLNDVELELLCNEPAGADMYVEPWPDEYQNVNFYALYKPPTLDVDLDWAVWLAGVEYVGGEPYLFALIRFVWEP